MRKLRTFLIFLTVISGIPECAAEQTALAETCSYEVAVWNVRAKKVIEVRQVRHPYISLSEEEIDPATGCTVCSEDQVTVSLPALDDFRLCRKMAPKVRETLLTLIEDGVPVLSVRGYQVVRSRGDIDANGNRTMLSNHSFGTAIDINRELNGLYDRCAVFGPSCRLVLGGRWRPGVPGTLVEDGPIVLAMKELGFKWGGEIRGNQKDFMHFSFTGY